MRVNGFYGHIQRNRMRSLVMFAGFLVAMQMIAAVVLTVPLFFFKVSYSPIYHPAAYFSAFFWPVAAASVILFSGNYFLHLYNVQEMAGFRRVSLADEPRLCRIVETLAIMAGLPMPAVAVIPSNARNAFAAGLGQRSAIVVVTRGLLEALDDEQLEAVVAHEIAHITNGDIGAMAVANAMLASLFMIAKRNPLRLNKWYKLVLSIIITPLLILYLLAGFISYVATTLGMLSRYIIASSREFIADAQAVQMTKNPAALISALQVIEGRSEISGLDSQLDAMMIDGATMGAYASHPPLSERIAVLTKLAGGMAVISGQRRDTRAEAQRGSVPQVASFAGHPDIAQLRAAFLAQAATEPSVRGEPPKSLIARLNAGSGVNRFGMTPGMQKAATYIAITFAALALLSAFQFSKQSNALIDLTPRDDLAPLTNGPPDTQSAIRLKKMNITYNVRDPGDWRLNPSKMATMHPLIARCFESHYRAGDKGIVPISMPKFESTPYDERFDPSKSDNGLVAYSYGAAKKAEREEFELLRSLVALLDRYRAQHTKALELVEAAPDEAARDLALNNYVRERKFLLGITHRLFVGEGLSVMREAFASERDAKVIEMLRKRMAEGGQFSKSEREAQELALLLDSPADFIPCQARAEVFALATK